MDKHGLPTKTLSMPIRVSSQGAEMIAGVGCHQLTLSIGKHEFPTDLIILKSQGLDIILGMVLLIVPVDLLLSVHQEGRGSNMYASISIIRYR